MKIRDLKNLLEKCRGPVKYEDFLETDIVFITKNNNIKVLNPESNLIIIHNLRTKYRNDEFTIAISNKAKNVPTEQVQAQ